MSFVLLGGQSHAPLWQAGYGHSKPTCNHEAQQGPVKLSFLCQLRLHVSTRVCVSPVKHGLSIWFVKIPQYLQCHPRSLIKPKVKGTSVNFREVTVIFTHLFPHRDYNQQCCCTCLSGNYSCKLCEVLHKQVRQVICNTIKYKQTS